MSRDPATGLSEPKRVTQTSTRLAPQVLTLTFSDPQSGDPVETITCTPGHPFYVLGKGFVLAGQLGIGTQIVTRAGPALIVEEVTWHSNADGTEQDTEVYNFTVEDDHSYFVGTVDGGVWVHNDSFSPISPGDDLTGLMGDSGLTPTQPTVNADNVNSYAQSMMNGNWDWNQTATDPRQMMMKDSNGNIMAGHHRFVAAQVACIKIPDGVVKTLDRPSTRAPRPWSSVKVLPGSKGPRISF